MKLSIIIPAYNEEKRIRKTLEEYLRVFDAETEIMVILNGCQDNTLRIVEEIQKRHPRLIFHNFPESILKGGAVLEGFSRAQGDLIGYTDADGATNAEEFKRLSQISMKYDGVIASRRLSGATIITPQPLIRRLSGKIFNTIVRLLFQFPYRDTQCGAKIFKKDVIRNIKNKITTKDWAFDIDLLYQAKKANYDIQEIPSVWSDREDSKLNVTRVAPKMLLSVLKLRLKNSPFTFLLP